MTDISRVVIYVDHGPLEDPGWFVVCFNSQGRLVSLKEFPIDLSDYQYNQRDADRLVKDLKKEFPRARVEYEGVEQ